MTRVGRPSKLDDDVVSVILAARRKGLSKKDAAIKAGIGRSTFMLWQKKARDAESAGKRNEYLDFIDLLDAAEVFGVDAALESINSAGKTDWRAAAWIAAHLRPDEFGDKQSVKAEHSGEIKITINSKVKP